MTSWTAPISGTNPVNLAGNDLGVFIGPSVTLSVAGAAVTMSGSSEVLDLYGTVVGTVATAIYIGAGSASTGHIIHVYAGAFVRAFGNYGVYVLGSGAAVNEGDVYGISRGFSFTYSGATASLTNTGKIAADVNGVFLDNDPGSTFTLINKGTIKGGSASSSANHSFFGDDGRDVVTNTGRMIGTIDLNTGNDEYKGAAGHAIGHVLGKGGLDKITGGTDNDWFDGGDGNDTLTGNAGADRLIGGTGPGADKLIGGLGIDTETGGLGNDIFVFSAPVSSANRDVITDFHNAPGENDAFYLENAFMPTLGGGAAHLLNPAFFYAGAAAHDANDHIVYNHANGALLYDSNASAAGGATLIAVITDKPVLTYADFLVI